MSEIEYYYSAFGLKIRSQIPLPELIPEPEIKKVDVTIALGQVSQLTPEDPTIKRRKFFYRGGKGRLIFHIKQVGTYNIKDGKEITIEPVENAEMQDLRLYLLGSAMGALLWQRGIFPIHGSTLCRRGEEQCFLVTGVQKAGKSTLAAALIEDGYEIITDDVSPAVFDREGNPWVLPSYPQQKLTKDTLNFLGKETTSFTLIMGRINKYAVPREAEFSPSPKRLKNIYEMERGNGERVKLQPVIGMDKLRLIMSNVYRFGFAQEMGLEKEIFLTAAKMAEKVTLFQIIRPEDVITVKEVKETILHNLGNGGSVFYESKK